MGNDERALPFFFAKHADMIEPDGATIPYPPLTKDLHHEVELIVAMKSGGLNIPADRPRAHLRLWCRHRPYAPRSATGRAQERAALGSRQIVRPFRALRRAATGRENRPPGPGADLALGQRHRTAKGRPHRADLERAGDHRETVGAGSTRRRRHHHDGNAGRGRSTLARRQNRMRGRWHRHPEGGDREAGLAAGYPPTPNPRLRSRIWGLFCPEEEQIRSPLTISTSDRQAARTRALERR